MVLYGVTSCVALCYSWSCFSAMTASHPLSLSLSVSVCLCVSLCLAISSSHTHCGWVCTAVATPELLCVCDSTCVDSPLHSADAKAPACREHLVVTRACVSVMQVQKLHLYSIAAPGMRRWPENTQDLSVALSWADPVNMKPGWVQLQNGYWQAPGRACAACAACGGGLLCLVCCCCFVAGMISGLGAGAKGLAGADGLLACCFLSKMLVATRMHAQTLCWTLSSLLAATV